MNRLKLENDENWNNYREQPFFELREGYKISVTPPFGGALTRFRILAPNKVEYSIYFDVNDALGIVGSPYYELYPYYEGNKDGEGDTKRYYEGEFNDILIDIYIMTEGSEIIKKELPEYFV